MRRRSEQGFTLVELTVALVAGLIVALGIMGLSKDATRTFHEEMRGSAAEANLRTAVDRLRADLGRAGFMSTANVLNDPSIDKAPGVANPTPTPLLGLHRLASIRLFPGQSATVTPLSLLNGVTPDALEIGGNMTTSDQYPAYLKPAGAVGGGGSGCPRIYLNLKASGAVYRLLGSSSKLSDQANELNNAFQPSPTGDQFMVRVFEKATKRTQYLATCPGTPTTGIAGVAPDLEPWVAVDPSTPVLTGQQTGTVGGLGGMAEGQMWISPVQIVRWELMPAASEPTQYIKSPLGGQPLSPTVSDPAKYDLVRSYVDAGKGIAIPSTTEIIAEYAVDFTVAFTVDQGPNALLPKMVSFPFGDANNKNWGDDVNSLGAGALTAPQRIRSVRARLVTRTAQGDRTLNVPGPDGTYLYRYCIVGTGCDPVNAPGALQYARARTVTAEVALTNQGQDFYN